MTVSHSIIIDAPQKLVFAIYQNVGSWPHWDQEVAEVVLSKGLQPGAQGWLRPRQGPKARILVDEVVPEKSFTVEAQLPLCRMIFGHELAEISGQTRATHWVRFSGPLAFLFRRLIGAGLDASLPQTLIGLKHACEAPMAD